MRWLGVAAAGAALIFANSDGRAQSPEPTEQYEISRSYETAEESSDGSTGSSSGHDRFVERVIGIGEGGVELEYYLPREATAEDRARTWQFPVRVLRQPAGSMLLLNRSELEARLERWLLAAGWTREVCGRWIFTWNAFRIECDPQSVLKTVEELSLRSAELREGGLYQNSSARRPGVLERIADGPDGARLAVVLEVDPDAVRRVRAEADVAVGEIMRTPVTLEAARRARARERVSGTIEVRFDVDSAGNAWRRTTVTTVRITDPDSASETSTATETLERRRVSGATGR